MVCARSRAIGRRRRSAIAGEIPVLRAGIVLIVAAAGVALWPETVAAHEDMNPESRDTPLVVAAVQFEVTEENAGERTRFESEIREAVGHAAEQGSDLVVFPEYLNVFPAVSGQDDFLNALSDLDLTGEQIQQSVAGSAGSRRSAIARLFGALHAHTDFDSVHELFASSSESISRWMDRAYGRAAGEYSVTVIAGSYFAIEETPDGDSQLTNRAVVYGPDGERLYEQDKVFLTPFEREVVELSRGDPADARGFEVEGWSIGLTICRDTYFPVWNDVHGGRDLWIDLRGEGTEYDASVRERLQGAVPERLLESEVPYGLTIFLTGEFHGLFWEGRSNAVAASGDSIERLSEAEEVDEHELLVVELDRP